MDLGDFSVFSYSNYMLLIGESYERSFENSQEKIVSTPQLAFLTSNTQLVIFVCGSMQIYNKTAL